MTYFFQSVKDHVGLLDSEIFMSDDAPAYYNAWGFSNENAYPSVAVYLVYCQELERKHQNEGTWLTEAGRCLQGVPSPS